MAAMSSSVKILLSNAEGDESMNDDDDEAMPSNFLYRGADSS